MSERRWLLIFSFEGDPGVRVVRGTIERAHELADKLASIMDAPVRVIELHDSHDDAEGIENDYATDMEMLNG